MPCKYDILMFKNKLEDFADWAGKFFENRIFLSRKRTYQGNIIL